jgi:hypothetical protein
MVGGGTLETDAAVVPIEGISGALASRAKHKARLGLFIVLILDISSHAAPGRFASVASLLSW